MPPRLTSAPSLSMTPYQQSSIISTIIRAKLLSYILGNEEVMDDDLFNLSMVSKFGDDITTSERLRLNEKGDELQEQIALAVKRRNVFLTGKAGTGKSWTTERIVHSFTSANKTIHVTAPTGVAAINVNGTTINAWGGYGLGTYYSDFDRMMEKSIRKKIQKAHSMLDGELFDILECVVSII
jgi:predicted GTPase